MPLSCSLEKHEGNLVILSKGIIFSCIDFKVKVRWKDVKEMTPMSKRKDGEIVRSILIELYKGASPGVTSYQDGIISPKIERGVLQFFDFKDFIAVTDKLKLSRMAYQERKKVDVPLINQVDKGKAEREPDLPRFSLGEVAQGMLCASFSEVRSVFFFLLHPLKFVLYHALELNVFVCVMLVIILASLTPSNLLPKSSGMFSETSSLLESLDRFQQQLASDVPSSLNDYAVEKEKKIIGSSRVWMDKLERAVAELGDTYVLTQVKLNDLRQKRAERLFEMKEMASNSGVDETLWATAGKPGKNFQMYEELWRNQVLSQKVTTEDRNERLECLQIIEDLIKIADLVEKVFSQFMTVLLRGALDDMATGRYVSHHWSPLHSENDKNTKERSLHEKHSRFTPEQVLATLWFRRHLDGLLYSDPLEPNDYKRRKESEEYLDIREEFQVLENHLSRWGLKNKTAKEKMLVSFYKNIVQRHWTEKRTSLRNIMDELLFWSTYEELWGDQIAHYLTKIEDSEGYFSNSARNSFSNEFQWENLPIFRGLLCFADAPRLTKKGIDALYDEKMVTGKGATDLLVKKQDPFNPESRLVYVEAIAFKQLTDEIRKRWLNDFELFRDALTDVAEKSKTRKFVAQFFPVTTQLPSRARLTAILRDVSKQIENTAHPFVSVRFLLGSGKRGEALKMFMSRGMQSVYSKVIGNYWGSMKNQPFLVLNTLVTPTQLLSEVISLTNLLFFSVVLLLITIIILPCYRLFSELLFS